MKNNNFVKSNGKGLRYSKWHRLFLLAGMLLFISVQVRAQLCGFATGEGCSNTNYDNAFLKTLTYNDPATIEYDNFVSSYHASMIRTSSGGFKVWGEAITNTGTYGNNFLTPQDLNSTNYPSLGTAKVLKVTAGSDGTSVGFGYANSQFIVLASNGLYAWGQEGRVIANSITSNTTFQKISVNGKADGLPVGVTPSDVKMITAASTSLVIVTCSGDVWVLSQVAASRGNGSTGSNTVWSQVEISAGNYLSNIIAARIVFNDFNGGGSDNTTTLMALKSDGTLWTWGSKTFLGNTTAVTSRTRATEMIKPSGTPKMIGVTVGPSYYVLMTDGNLYSLGMNSHRQLGDWSTTDRTSWVQPRYTSTTGQVMDNIAWISPQENDGLFPSMNVLTTSANLYTWGRNSSNMVGGTANPANPQMPLGVSSTDKIIAVESGGHTTMLVKECSSNFGYVGHRINGSMGNGSAANVDEDSYTFNTAPVEICAAEPVNVTVPTAGPYCSGATLQLAGSPSGGTYSVTSGPATVSSTGLVTFTGGGNAVIQYTSPSSCGGTISKEITLVANSVTPGVIAANQSVSTGGDPAAFTTTTAATGSGTLSYQWQSSTDNGATWNNISGANSTTYDPPAGITTTTQYRRADTSTLSGAVCTAYSNVVTVSVSLVDIQVNKTGPLSAQTGSTISYSIHVTNNGSSNAANVIVKDPAVANFTATGITCTAGSGTLGSAVCPSSVTLAALQGAGLTIPSLPADSGVTFTVTGTVGTTSGAVITNTATAEYAADTNIANNSSAISTTIYTCTGDESVYTIDSDATVAANTIAPNGGTINLVYKLTSGTAVPGIGNQFSLPVTYTDLNNQFGIDNQWEGFGVNSGVTISPKTSVGTGRLYNGLPSNNSTSETMVSPDTTDNLFTTKIFDGNLDPLGKFNVTIGNYPAVPSGYVIKSNNLSLITSNNNITDNIANLYYSGFWLKPLIQTAVNTTGATSTPAITAIPGQTYVYRYSAYSNGTSFSQNAYPSLARGFRFSSTNSITFANSSCTLPYCYKPGLLDASKELPTKVGITSLSRAGADDPDNWPMVRKGGYIALESQTKGFVPNRVAFSGGNPVGIPTANFVEGMMVYDTTNKCMKVYTLKEGDTSMAWHCVTTQACPDTDSSYPLAPRNVNIGFWGTSGYNFNSNHGQFKSQLENTANYSASGTFKGINGWTWINANTDINATAAAFSAAQLKAKYDIIVTGYNIMTAASATKIKEYTDLGGVVFVLMDGLNVGNVINTAFGGSGFVSPGPDAPAGANAKARTLNNAVSNSTFGTGGGITITGANGSSLPPVANIPAGSSIISYMNYPTATDTGYIGVYTAGNGGRAIFVYDEGIFRNASVSGTIIDTPQEIFIHNLMSYALQKAGFSAN